MKETHTKKDKIKEENKIHMKALTGAVWRRKMCDGVLRRKRC